MNGKELEALKATPEWKYWNKISLDGLVLVYLGDGRYGFQRKEWNDERYNKEKKAWEILSGISEFKDYQESLKNIRKSR